MPELIRINRSPCVSCPYRKDVPSGIWDKSEYEKIKPYDNETFRQPPSVFMCHQTDGSLCRGWLDCHGYELIAMRLACLRGKISPAEANKALGEKPFVPIFPTAAAAAKHGLKAIKRPSRKAQLLMDKIELKRDKNE